MDDRFAWIRPETIQGAGLGYDPQAAARGQEFEDGAVQPVFNRLHGVPQGLVHPFRVPGFLAGIQQVSPTMVIIIAVVDTDPVSAGDFRAPDLAVQEPAGCAIKKSGERTAAGHDKAVA